MLETLTTLFQPWADLYAEQTTLATTIIAIHVLAMFVGGGIAIGADRRVLQAAPGTAEAHRAVAEELRLQHTVVIGAIVLVVASGLALATADVGTFAQSRVFWSKMGVFALLIVNGIAMRRTEGRLISASSTAEVPAADAPVALPWGSLRFSALVSLTGWLIVVLLGVVLSNG
jgi:hypothetical protein